MNNTITNTINMNCNYCSKPRIKNGKQAGTGKQKYQCKSCKKYQQCTYIYKAYEKETDEQIIKHVKRSNGIRDISYLLNISHTTVIQRIRKIANGLESTFHERSGRSYEMDELYTFAGNKKNPQWVIYAICRHSRKVVDLVVGRRDGEHIKIIIDKVLSYFPRRIYTDKLNIYPGLIPSFIHKAGRYITNRIERKNLTLRTHLKRLNRYTICYTKKPDMLEACLKIYFWV